MLPHLASTWTLHGYYRAGQSRVHATVFAARFSSALLLPLSSALSPALPLSILGAPVPLTAVRRLSSALGMIVFLFLFPLPFRLHRRCQLLCADVSHAVAGVFHSSCRIRRGLWPVSGKLVWSVTGKSDIRQEI